jgi:predicted permease
MIDMLVERFTREVSAATRSLRHTPGFTISVILILGISIGMMSAMFSVFDALLLRGLPVADPERVVRLVGMDRATPNTELAVGLESYRRFEDETQTLSSVAAYAHYGTVAYAIRDGDRRLDLRQAAVTGTFFDVLGARPMLGRLLVREDDRPWGPDGANTGDYNIVLSYGAWKRDFSGERNVIGRRLQTADVDWNPVIVGVAQPGLDFPRGADYWIPANYGTLRLIGRIAPGATAEAVRVEYANFLATDPIHGDIRETTSVQPLREAMVGDVRPSLIAMVVAAGLLLLLACINIANLLVLRSAGRVRELAVMRALGADSPTIVRHLFAECAILAVGGGALGFWLARLLLQAFLLVAPTTLPRTDVVAETGVPLAVAASVTLLTLLLFGLLPAVGALRFDLTSPLRSDGRSGTGGRRLRRLRHGLVASQIALALMVLAGAGLLVRSFARLAHIEFGYRTDQLSVIHLAPPYDRYVEDCGGNLPGLDSVAGAQAYRCYQERKFALHDHVEARLTVLRDVRSVSSSLLPPFMGPSVWSTKVIADHQAGTDGSQNPWVGIDGVGPAYFETLQLPILEGRAFTSADREGAPRVAVVSESVARTLWPDQNALGRRFNPARFPQADSQVTVVGIVPDVHYREHRTSTPTIYQPFRQSNAQGTFVVRTQGPLSAALPHISSTIAQIDSEIVVTSAKTLDELVAPHLSQPRLHALLLSVFGLTALVLAAIGLYGIMASAVAQRTRELGVRVALGATATQLGRMVVREAGNVTLIGAIIGLAGAFAGSQLMRALLFEVSPVDPLTLIIVSTTLLAVTLLAAYLPARRAAKIDPAITLRSN